MKIIYMHIWFIACIISKLFMNQICCYDMSKLLLLQLKIVDTFLRWNKIKDSRDKNS